jgi:hypothetical protein
LHQALTVFFSSSQGRLSDHNVAAADISNFIEEGPYMSTPAEYRQSAELCLQAMRASANLETRAALVSLAQHWIKLAERAENISRTSRERDASGKLICSSPVA